MKDVPLLNITMSLPSVGEKGYRRTLIINGIQAMHSNIRILIINKGEIDSEDTPLKCKM